MAKPVLTVVALVPPPTSFVPNVTDLSGGMSQDIGDLGGGFKIYSANQYGDVGKLIGDNNFNWTGFSGSSGGMVPVFQQYNAGASRNVAYHSADVAGLSTVVDSILTSSNAGAWLSSTAPAGWGIQATFNLKNQVHRKITVLGFAINGKYTVTASFADASMPPRSVLIDNTTNGYQYSDLQFAVEACAFHDTAVTISITQTTPQNIYPGGGISPFVTYIAPDIQAPRPAAFNAFMLSRNRGT